MDRKSISISESGLHKQLSLLDNLPGMAYRCRNARNWPMLFVSEGCVELCGYPPEALLDGRPHWGDLIHPDDRDAVWQAVQEAVKRGERFEIQYRIVTGDQQNRWVWERGSALDADEHGVLIEGFISDITAQREKELELERANAYATAIVDTAAEGIVLVDAEFRVESVNHAAARMFGVEGNDIVGRPARYFLPDEDFKVLRHDVAEYRDTGFSELLNGGREVTGRRADGSEFPMLLSMRELRLEGEHTYTALIRDISGQKAREDEIRLQNERLNATIRFSPVGIIMVGSDLSIVAANPAFASMLGYDVEELIGHRFSDFYHPDEARAGEQAVIASLAGGADHYSTKRRYVHKDGHTIHTALNVAVGHDSDGAPEFVVSNVVDLTERLGVEAQIRDQQDQLARLDRLSTLGEMMAGVAHEINQPLTAISTYAQSGLRFMDPRNTKPDRLRDALTKLSEQARRAGAVVERIRELARQDVSNNELVNINCLVKEIEELATIDARARGAHIRLELHEELRDTWCDPIQIQQVILNLIRNSVDAVEACDFENGDEIVLRTSVDDDGSSVISVIDCGGGVSEAAATDLFRPFSTHKKSGMGLGLSISRSIVTAHGGQLDYHNNPEAGATFYLTLPRVSGEIEYD